MPAAERTFTIAHISDLHCGGPYFVPTLIDRAIAEINDLQPDIVVCSGDLTTFGFKHEYRAGEVATSTGSSASRSSSSPGTTTRGTSATSTSRSSSATRNSVLRTVTA